MNYRYKLEPYIGIATRHTCPACGHHRIFSRYIDTETGELLASNVGRCERIDKCGYHLTPKQFFETNPEKKRPSGSLPIPLPLPVRPMSLIPPDQFKKSLDHYQNNHFIHFLDRLFGSNLTSHLIAQYFIGTSKHWPGATVFWQIDIQGRIRTGKVMLYNPYTGKRVKQPYSHITWVHKILFPDDYELRQCFFGEHLLARHPEYPVGIVESEKTAIIASAFFPNLIWLAACNKQGLSLSKCSVLTGKKVTLFPDLNAFELWTGMSKQLSSIASVKVSGLLERNASAEDKQNGLDLADYLTRFPINDFQIIKPKW